MVRRRDPPSCYFIRTNRRQNVMEVKAANPATGAGRVYCGRSGHRLAGRRARGCYSSPRQAFIWESKRTTDANNFIATDPRGRCRSLTFVQHLEGGTKLVKIDEKGRRAVLYGARRRQPAEVSCHRVGPRQAAIDG